MRNRFRESFLGGWRRTATPGIVLLLLSFLPQQRDITTPRVGTGEITGVVMSAATDPRPVRRVVVSISGDVGEPVSVITDDSGRFTFTRLPAGTFTISARKITYLPAQFGATRPGGAGSAVALAAGEKRTISIMLHKGVVLAGTLRDPAGVPMPGIPVAAIDLRARPVNTVPPNPESVTTDDRGMFRFYGLPPSEYVVAAAPSAPGTGVIGARSSAELDTLFGVLQSRLNRTLPAAAAPAVSPAPAIGYSPIYFPGTAMFGEAARLRAVAGEEKDGLNFTVPHVPVASIEGTITGNTQSLASVTLAIIPDAPRLGSMPGTRGITSTPPDANGAFTYGNLAPGRYRIVARARRSGGTDPGAPPAANARVGLGGGAPPPGVKLEPMGDMLYAAADVEIRGQHVTGVNMTLQPAGFFSGRLIFDADNAPLPDDVTAFRVQVQQIGGTGLASSGSTRVGNAITTVLPVNVRDDGTFLITGLGPTPYHVVVQPPAALASTWKARSAMFEGRDLLDTNFDGTYAQMKDVRITLSDKRTEVAGTLQSASGQPASEYYVVAFSVERTNWTAGSRRTAVARPATNGRYVLADLPAGEYFLAALTDLDPSDLGDPQFLEQLAPAAVKITIAEGQKKTQDLRIR